MAERMLRDWTQSESIDLLSAEAEVFFTRLIMKADDYGNYIGHPKLLRAALYPLRDTMKDAKIDGLIDQCAKAGVITPYEVDGKRYIHIPNYGQRLRTMKGKYPAPDGNVPTNVSRLQTNAVEGKGREVETEERVKAYGPTHDNYILIKSTLHRPAQRVNGKAGLIEYMEANKSVLNNPGLGDKFMMSRRGKAFNEFSHVWNDYNSWVERQFK